MKSQRQIFWLICFVVLGMVCANFVYGQPKSLPGYSGDTWLLELHDGRRYAGRIEFEDDTDLLVTRRGGRLTKLKPSDVKRRKRLSLGFTPVTPRKLREKLQREFGSKYTVSLTSHFVVVHPPGDYQKFAMPFEQLYVRFKAWLATRGMTIDEPEFPLVAVVLRTRAEFDRMSSKRELGDNVVGYYAHSSNRLITYQTDYAWLDAAANWKETADTIVHEAVHQTASNCGVHSRVFATPVWVAEGLATTFEADGINNYFAHPEFNDRINWDRLKSLRRLYASGRADGRLGSLVTGDALFKSDPETAYALSWALTFYLSQQQPKNYVAYLAAMQRDEAFSAASGGMRMKYFESAFGSPEKMEGSIKAFVQSLPEKR